MIKKWLFSIVVFVLFTACSGQSKEEATPKTELPASITNQIVAEEEFQHEIDDLDTIIKLADDIIIGEIAGTEAFDSMTQKITVKVDEAFKGDLSDGETVALYENDFIPQVGDTVLLFLEFFNSTLYPEPIYTSIGEQTIVYLDQATSTTDSQLFHEFKSVDEIISFIEDSPSLPVKNNQRVTVFDAIEDPNELYRESDFVVEIVPTEINATGTQVSNFKFNVLTSYKERKFDERFINLPSDVKIGEKYLVYLKEYGENAISLTSRQGSLLHSSDDDWEKHMDLLLNKIE